MNARIGLLVGMAGLASLSMAQQAISFAEALDGKRVPAVIKAKDLPAEFYAVKITITGENSILDLYGGAFAFQFRGGGDLNDERQRAREALLVNTGVYWTKGETVRVATASGLESQKLGTPIEAEEYLVAYKLDIPIVAFGGPSSSFDTWALENPLDLSLQLIRPTSIAKMTPVPTLSPDKMAKAVDAFQRTLADELGVAPDRLEAAVASGQTSTRARQTSALSNAKQLALGLIMYGTDYDDMFPAKQSTEHVQNVTRPYLKNNSLWKTGNPNGSRFLFNVSLSGFSMTDVPKPAEMPMIYENTPWPDGRRVVAFTDGHAKLVSSTEWNKMAHLLKAKLKRTNGKARTATPAPPRVR